MTAETGASDRRLGRWGVRFLALAGSLLIAVAAFGWWLDSRVVSDNGFADVVAKASQQPEVRDYVADQATLRLARSSNFVSGARPIVSDALSNAIATPPVEDAVREFAARAHQQVFKTGTSQRVDIDAQQASTTIRSALQTINPSLSKKLPANVLDASATISQNSVVDMVFKVSRWIWLWIPIGILGVALLAIALARARDRVRAIRTVGIVLAISGALLAGVGVATPALAGVAAKGDVARGDAVAAFIGVLIGRLVGAGLALILIGLAVALAPGKDGGDLTDRVQRVRVWVQRKRTSPRWRFAGGIALFLFAASVLTRPTQTARTLVDLVAILGLYVAIVICLRASGVLETDHSIARLKKRQVAGVLGAMLAASVVTGSLAIVAVSATTSAPKANPVQSGCNGYMELCPQPIDQLVWPASHNAMSSSAYNFLGAEHTITIPEQLNAGARFLMLDAYYGYNDDGIVRTNLAGGVDRKTLEKERGPDAVRALDRIGALTGTADTSGHKQDVYFCHDLCELGAVKASDVFDGVSSFLDRNLTDVVILDLEDYVQPKDVRAALDDAGLGPRLLTLTPEQLHTKTLLDIVTPKKGHKDAPRRLIVVSEKHGGVAKWLPKTYSLFQETPYTFTSVKDFTCAPNRGGTDKPLLLINHWLRPDGPPDPTAATTVNSREVLTKRFKACIARRKRLPNAVAVDFTSIGDFYPTINRFNAAVAKVTGVSDAIDRVVAHHQKREDLTPAQLSELKGLRRLPKISAVDALKLLGPVAGTLVHPAEIDKFERQNGLEPPTQSTTTTVPAPANP